MRVQTVAKNTVDDLTADSSTSSSKESTLMMMQPRLQMKSQNMCIYS